MPLVGAPNALPDTWVDQCCFLRTGPNLMSLTNQVPSMGNSGQLQCGCALFGIPKIGGPPQLTTQAFSRDGKPEHATNGHRADCCSRRPRRIAADGNLPADFSPPDRYRR